MLGRVRGMFNHSVFSTMSLSLPTWKFKILDFRNLRTLTERITSIKKAKIS